MAQIEYEKLNTKEALTSELGKIFYELVTGMHEIFNFSTLDSKTIESMLDDEAVGSALDFLASYTNKYIGVYTHPDEKVDKLVKNSLKNLEESLKVVTKQIVEDLVSYGFCVAEIVWESQKGYLLTKKIVPLPPETLSFIVEEGEIIGVKQYIADKEIKIGIEKLLIIRNGRNIYGKSRFNRLYRYWRFKQFMIKLWAAASERYAMPGLHGLSDTTNREDLLTLLQNFWSMGALVTDTLTEVKTIEPNSRIYENFQPTIMYLNSLIYMALLMPQLLSGTNDVGSRSLGEVHLELFTDAIKDFAELISEKITDQIIYKIIAFNLGEMDDYGSFSQNYVMSIEDRLKLSQFFQTLSNIGVIDPINGDNKWIRDQLLIPVIKEDNNIHEEEETQKEDDSEWPVSEE